jgi:uncharacterized cupin superfamily protein
MADMSTGVTFGRLEAEGERFQTLRRELGVSTFGLNLIRLAPGQRGRIHRHERQEEVFIVLDGVLTLVVDGGEEHDLDRWACARVGPEVRRQLVNRGPGDALVLAMGGASEHAGRDGVAYLTFEDAEGAPPQSLPLPDDLPASELRT